MYDVEGIIRRCLESCKPPVQLYTEDDGAYHKIGDKAVADIDSAVEKLRIELGPILKDVDEQNEIELLKSNNAYLIGEVTAYEKFLKLNGFISEEEEGQASAEPTN